MSKMKRKGIVLLLALLAAILFLPLGKSTQAATPKLNKTSTTLAKGKRLQLKVSGTSQKPKWTTSNAKIATVNDKGVVKGKSKGTAKITAKVGKKKLTCKVTVDKPKLEGGIYATVGVGKSITLKASGTKGKAEWLTSDNNIATVSQSGVVRGIKAGSCRIYVHVSETSLVCILTVTQNTTPNPTINPTVPVTPTPGVSDKFNETAAKNSISYEGHRTDRGIVVIVKNNYKYGVKLDMDCLYYNSSNALIGKSSDSCYLLEPGREAALFAHNPYDSNYRDVEYSRYAINFTCKEPTTIGNANNIVCTANFGSGNVMATVRNSGQHAEFTVVSVVFYKNGNVVGYEYHYADVNNPGSTDYLEYSFPYDSEYNTIIPDNFKIFVNYSYRYSWS